MVHYIFIYIYILIYIYIYLYLFIYIYLYINIYIYIFIFIYLYIYMFIYIYLQPMAMFSSNYAYVFNRFGITHGRFKEKEKRFCILLLGMEEVVVFILSAIFCDDLASFSSSFLFFFFFFFFFFLFLAMTGGHFIPLYIDLCIVADN